MRVRSGSLVLSLALLVFPMVSATAAAVTTTLIHACSGKAGERNFASEFQFTDTVVKQAGRWRVAASHISRLPR